MSVNYKATGMYSMNHWLEDFYNLSKTCIINCIGTTIYKLDILNKFHIRFNESISYYEDIGFCTEYMCHIESLYYINEPIYWYRFINSNSLITKYKVKFVQSLWYLRSKQLKLFDSFCDIEKSQLYKSLGDQLVANIINLISHLAKSATNNSMLIYPSFLPSQNLNCVLRILKHYVSIFYCRLFCI